MPATIELIRQLADGKVHAGPALAGALGCSRAAIWKQLQGLPDLGLAVEARRGSGYRLSQPIELLDIAAIRAALDTRSLQRLAEFELNPVTASTNEVLRALGPPPAGRLQVALAEFQTAGRGRRGRQWLSPFGSGLCLSLGWQFDGVPGGIAGLSLALGVAAQRALADLGARGVLLKWPNDLVSGEHKLGGLLLDVSGEPTGPIQVIVGIGLNVYPSAALRDALPAGAALPPAALQSVCDGAVSRNRVAAGLIRSLGDTLAGYQQTGFAPFAEAWRGLDSLRNRPVSVQLGDQLWHGLARGIAADGALLVEREGRLQPVSAGDVSVRAHG